MPKIKKRETTAWIRAVAATYGKRVGDIGYMFVNDEKILEVNREYLGHDYYTDIITFDYCEDDTLNGDLVISLDTVKSNAELFKKDYNEELHRVIRGTTSRHYPRRSAPLRHQRQRSRRTRDNGSGRKQSAQLTRLSALLLMIEG